MKVLFWCFILTTVLASSATLSDEMKDSTKPPLPSSEEFARCMGPFRDASVEESKHFGGRPEDMLSKGERACRVFLPPLQMQESVQQSIESMGEDIARIRSKASHFEIEVRNMQQNWFALFALLAIVVFLMLLRLFRLFRLLADLRSSLKKLREEVEEIRAEVIAEETYRLSQNPALFQAKDIDALREDIQRLKVEISVLRNSKADIPWYSRWL